MGHPTVPPNPARIPPELSRKYATLGPRYTSYPPAPHFRPDLDWDALLARWRGSSDAPDPAGLSIYLHIPFCARRCFFCGCHTTIPRDDEIVENYLKVLAKESDLMATILDPSRPVRQMALGGGTPTFLSAPQLDRLLTLLAGTWTRSPDAEVSIEIDPRRVNDDQLDVLVRHGFNRFSLGVQDFDPEVLRIIGRPQSFEVTQELVSRLRDRGRSAINFDLIYGLPGQTVETMNATCRRVIELSPSRIALFGYAHVPWMKKHQTIFDRYGLPTTAERLALFGEAYDALTAGGYVPIGMDHFAKPDDELHQALQNRSLHRNFMGYTTRKGLDILGLGVSSIASVALSYAQNRKEFDSWQVAIDAGRPAFERGFLLTDEDALRRDILLDLFCNFSLRFGDYDARATGGFASHFAEELKRLEPMQDDGLVEISPDRLQVSPLGRVFIRNVCMVFDQYLERDQPVRQYSQTV